MNVPAKFTKRLTENLKKYQSNIQRLKQQQVNETDTVKIINDILEDLLGYDKYTEITSEHSINGTYCDLAIKHPDGKIHILIEAKGITIQLNDKHLNQAMAYGARQGCQWVILTNAEHWKVFKIKFGQPLDAELIFEFNLLSINIKDQKQLDALFAISKEGRDKSAINEIYNQNQIKNKYVVAALLDSPDVYAVIKRNFKNYFNKSIKLTDEEISVFIRNDIFKPQVIDTDEAKEARKSLDRVIKKIDRQKAKVINSATVQNSTTTNVCE